MKQKSKIVVLLVFLSILSLSSHHLSGQSKSDSPEKTAPLQASAERPPTVSVKEAKDHLIKRVDATYPAFASAAHVSGTVVLAVEITPAGDVTTVIILSGPEMLRAAAAAAVKEYKYRPFVVDGSPITVRTAVQIHFSMYHSKSD